MRCGALLVLLAILAGCSFEGTRGVGGSPADAGDVEESPIDAGDNEEVTPDAAAPTCLEPPAGIVAWWDGEELGVDIAGDFSMDEDDYRGAPAITAGLVGDALTIDDGMGGDTREWVRIAAAPQPVAFTVEGWIRRTSDDAGYQSIYALECESGLFLLDLRLTFFFDDVMGCGRDVAQGATELGTDWHHVAATSDGDLVRLFLDGSFDGDGQATVSLPGTATLGAVDVTNGGNHLFGQIDELTVYDRVLDDAEIAAISAAGAAGKCK
jgi:hypothetical protein